MEEDEENGRRRVLSLGEEQLTFFSAESRQRFSCSGAIENNVYDNKTPNKTTMFNKKINSSSQQTPKTTTSLFNKGGCLNKQPIEKPQHSAQRLQELSKRVEERRKWFVFVFY